MKKLLPVIIILVLLTIACGSTDSTSSPTSTPFEFEVKWTEIAKTMEVELTPQPTETESPTKTPEPTSTPKPPPDPITIEGDSNSVESFDLTEFGGSAAAHFTNKGSSNFAVWLLDDNNEQIDLLVNTIGNYDGYIPLNFFLSEQGSKLQIESEGSWKIEILPVEWIRDNHILGSKGTYSGAGDDIVVVKGAPAIANFSTNTTSNFAVWGVGDGGRDLLVNEIAPYSGASPLTSDVFMIIVRSEGPWTVELK